MFEASFYNSVALLFQSEAEVHFCYLTFSMTTLEQDTSESLLQQLANKNWSTFLNHISYSIYIYVTYQQPTGHVYYQQWKTAAWVIRLDEITIFFQI